ncbi:MAG: hypothetical protein ACK5YR_17075 [Pirellula sp.]
MIANYCRSLFLAVMLSLAGFPVVTAQETRLISQDNTSANATTPELASRFPLPWTKARNELVSYSPASESSLQVAQSSLAQTLTTLNGFFTANASWRAFLEYDVLLRTSQQKFESESQIIVSSEILKRWDVAGESLNLSQLYLASRQLRERNALAQQKLRGETAQTRKNRLDSLAKAYALFANEPSSERQVELVKVLRECELVGQAPDLVREVRRICLFPNLVIKTPRSSLVANESKPIRETFSTSGTYNRMQMNGTGSMIGTQSIRLLPNANAVEWEITLSGTSQATSRGAIAEVSIQSTSTAPITAAKRVTLTGWGRWSYGQSVASAPTTIRYDSIVPNSRGIARQRTISEVQASKRSSELQAQQETERTLINRLDRSVESFTRQLDLSPLVQLRNTLIATTADLLTIEHQSSAEDCTIFMQCYDHSIPNFAQTVPPRDAIGGTVASIHESLISLLLQSKLMKSQLGITVKPAGEADKSNPDSPTGFVGTNVKLVFHPSSAIQATCTEEGFKTIIRLKSISDGDTVIENCRIELDWDLTLTRSGLNMRRKESIRILPIDFVSGRDRLGLRQVSTYRALERSLHDAIGREQVLDLPQALVGKLNSETAKVVTRLGWLQLASPL